MTCTGGGLRPPALFLCLPASTYNARRYILFIWTTVAR